MSTYIHLQWNEAWSGWSVFFNQNSQKEALEALNIREGYKVYTSKVFIH